MQVFEEKCDKLYAGRYAENWAKFFVVYHVVYRNAGEIKNVF